MTTEPTPGQEVPADPPTDAPAVHWEMPVPGTARLGIGTVVGRTLDTYGSDPSIFLALALPAAVLLGVITAVPFGLGLAGFFAFVVAGGIAGLISSIAMMMAADDMWSGREPAFGDLLRRALGRTPALLWAYLVAVIGIVAVVAVLAVSFAVIPVLALVVGLVLTVGLTYAALRLALFGQVVAIEGIGGFAAFRRSWQLTKGSLWRLSGLSLILVLITLPASLGAELLVGSREPVMIGVATLLSALVTAPVLGIGSTLAWAALAERPYADNDVVRGGRGRTLALALLIGFGILLSVVGIARGGSTLTGLLPEAGSIRAGTQQNPFDPCQPLDVRTTFSRTQDIHVGGYFSETIPAGQEATIEVFQDGRLVVTEPIQTSDQATGCYHELEPLRDLDPAAYRIVVRYAGRTIAEGGFTVVP